MKKRGFVTAAVVCALSVCCASGIVACGNTDAAPHTPVAMDAVKTDIVVQGYEWGPAIPKIIVEFKDNVSGIAKDTFAVSVKSGWANAKRTVTDAYACDKDGNKTAAATKYVAVEMTVKYGEASPFVYDNATARNLWADSIPVTVTVNNGKSFTAGGVKYENGDKFEFAVKAENRLVPQTATWVKDTVTYNEDGKNITLSRASWAPEGASTDGGKNPLIIWLHGAGEGGTDIDIDLLGNEVTALTTDNATNVQHYFTSDTLKGAYVLAVQTPTMWMDSDGNGNYNNTAGEGKQRSYYTEALWKAITTYVDGNPDVDTNRIYLGGCSNGGYMTMNMMFEHGEYFTAFYPVCEAYMNSRISDDMIAQVKDYNIWFVLSEDDTTVDPQNFSVPTFYRLINSGAGNVHMTLFDHVRGVDDPNPAASFGTEKDCYMGHWSWIYAFNDAVKTEFDNTLITDKQYINSANCTKAGNMWQWLAAQTKNNG